MSKAKGLIKKYKEEGKISVTDFGRDWEIYEDDLIKLMNEYKNPISKTDKELTAEQKKNVKKMVLGTFGKEASKDPDILQLYIDCHLIELEEYANLKLQEYKEGLVKELEEEKKGLIFDINNSKCPWSLKNKLKIRHSEIQKTINLINK